MKKTILFSLLFLCGLAGYSQKFIGSVIAGANFTQVDGDQVAGYQKVGFVAGGSVALALDKNQTWFVTLEALYSQKGSRRRSLIDDMIYFNPNYIDFNYLYNPNIKYRLEMDYVEIPLWFSYEDRRTGWTFGAGFAWGRMVRITELENGWTLQTNLRTSTYKKNEWSVLADVKFPIYKNLKFGFRFQYTLAPLRTRTYTHRITHETWVRKQYNNVLSIRLIYTFNEKYVPNPRVEKKGKRAVPRWIKE